MTRAVVPRKQWIRAIVFRLSAFSVAWWAVSEGDPSMIVYGIPSVIAATVSSLLLLKPNPPFSRQIPALVRLLGWFVDKSIRGGLDVARRALRRQVDVDPEIVEVDLVVRNRIARVVLADISCLTPGSLSVDLTDSGIRIHVLHRELPVREQIHDLERLIVRAFPHDDEDGAAP